MQSGAFVEHDGVEVEVSERLPLRLRRVDAVADDVLSGVVVDSVGVSIAHRLYTSLKPA